MYPSLSLSLSLTHTLSRPLTLSSLISGSSASRSAVAVKQSNTLGTLPYIPSRSKQAKPLLQIYFLSQSPPTSFHLYSSFLHLPNSANLATPPTFVALTFPLSRPLPPHLTAVSTIQPIVISTRHHTELSGGRWASPVSFQTPVIS